MCYLDSYEQFLNGIVKIVFINAVGNLECKFLHTKTQFLPDHWFPVMFSMMFLILLTSFYACKHEYMLVKGVLKWKSGMIGKKSGKVERK